MRSFWLKWSGKVAIICDIDIRNIFFASSSYSNRRLTYHLADKLYYSLTNNLREETSYDYAFDYLPHESYIVALSCNSNELFPGDFS